MCIYCLRIDSSGIAANTHRHLLACEADRKTKKGQEHSQEREQEQTASASQSLVVIIGIAASHHQRHCREAHQRPATPMHVRVFKPARAALPLAVYDGHGQAATFYYQFAQSGRRQVDARSAELGLLARPQATAKASGGGAKRLEVRWGRKARAPRWRTQARRRR